MNLKIYTPNSEYFMIKLIKQFDECKNNVIIKHNWSGDDTLNQPISIFKKNKYYKQLNFYDADIWIHGISGFLLVTRKYIIRAMQ